MSKELSWEEQLERDDILFKSIWISYLILIFGCGAYISYWSEQFRAFVFAWIIILGTFGIVYGILKFKYWLEKQ